MSESPNKSLLLDLHLSFSLFCLFPPEFMFFFPKLSSDICEGVVGLELVACQTWFSCKALAATFLAYWPSTQLPVKEGWKDNEIIGQTMKERKEG